MKFKAVIYLYSLFFWYATYGQSNRIAVVIGDQFKDPMSYLVQQTDKAGAFSGNEREPAVRNPVDFYYMSILLKSWGMPFDIFRLDQQFLDYYMFIGPDEQPKYGTILWMVNENDKLLNPDLSIINEVLEKHNMGFLALSNRITQPEIQKLLGIRYHGEWAIRADNIEESPKKHFVTKDLSGPINDGPPLRYYKRQQVELAGATVLASHGEFPAITVFEEDGSRSVWIGGDEFFMWDQPNIRRIIRKALVWTTGYGLYKTWENTGLMWIDDFGNAQNAWLDHWHYPTLSAETIDKYLIQPLLANNDVLNINMVPGFVNDEKGRLEPAFTQVFTDEFGTRQDYVSTKKGLEKGLELGVFSMQNHGLTHMQPDLVSPPTWYGSDLDKERAEVGWYREFGDIRRQKEIPAAEQFWRMKTTQEWTKYQFGVYPLSFNGGGPGASINTYENHTYRIAGRAGFGWASGYVGPDLAFHGWAFDGTEDSPHQVSAPPDRHDFGIYKDPEGFQQVFKDYPEVRFMSANEFIGYLHSSTNGMLNMKDRTLNLQVDYDPYYCVFFEDNPSVWTLEVADWVIDSNKEINLQTDDGSGRKIKATAGKYMISVPEGTGKHNFIIKF